MRKVFLVVLWLLAACSKNSRQGSGLLGNWKLTSFIHSVMGNGVWQTADTLNPKYIQFNRDSTLTFSQSNLAAFNNAYRYRLTSDSTMIFFEAGGTTPVTFQLTDTVLTLYPGCIEECVERYSKVR